MNKKSLSMLLSGLLVVSLTGVGFASWIIVSNSTASADGKITAESITDKRVGLKVTMEDASVNFGATKDASTTYNWLQNDGAGEDMNFGFTIELSKIDYLKSFTIAFSVVDEEGETTNANKFSAASNYVVAPDMDSAEDGNQPSVTYTIDTDTFTSDNWTIENGTYTKSFEYSFTWGSAFKPANSDTPINPFEYYNNQALTDSLATEANTAMTAIHGLNELRFIITVTANV